ncbi:MAG: phosphoribosylformylglycinamidine synthase I [Candidatus Brocadiia bacterium]
MSREKPVRVVVLRTAGTNCDVETAYAFEKVGAEAERVHVNRLAENRRGLDRFHILAIPGGFSYGDDIASGKVLANEIRYRMEDEVRRFVADGKLIIGICNGFQVLAKAGLLPRLHGDRVEATLTINDRALFEARWVHLRVGESPCVFVRPGDSLYLPVAHGEGKFIAEKDVLDEIERKKLVVARYVGPDGESNPGYPWNPNGSVADIAGICDPTGRIFGLMPHPERHVEPTQHPRWTREGAKPEGDGVRVFRNAVDFARRNLV